MFEVLTTLFVVYVAYNSLYFIGSAIISAIKEKKIGKDQKGI